MISTKLIESGSLLDHELTYVVLGARFKDQWIFVRHRERQSWEMPAGHIEAGEVAHEAAARELREETGASLFKLKPICDYQLEYEIEELCFSTGLPSSLTYPEVQSLLFQRVEEFLNQGL